MQLMKQLWNDTHGAVYSAEAVLLGSVVLTGASVGLSTVSQSLNEELTDFSAAIRSLDQSYSIPAQTGVDGATTSGSSFSDNVTVDIQSVTGQPAEESDDNPSTDDATDESEFSA